MSMFVLRVLDPFIFLYNVKKYTKNLSKLTRKAGLIVLSYLPCVRVWCSLLIVIWMSLNWVFVSIHTGYWIWFTMFNSWSSQFYFKITLMNLLCWIVFCVCVFRFHVPKADATFCNIYIYIYIYITKCLCLSLHWNVWEVFVTQKIEKEPWQHTETPFVHCGETCSDWLFRFIIFDGLYKLNRSLSRP